MLRPLIGVSLRPPRALRGADQPREAVIRTALAGLPVLALLLAACATGSEQALPAAAPLTAPETAPPPAAPPATAPLTVAPEDPLAPGPLVDLAPPVGQPTCDPAALTLTHADTVYGRGVVQELFVLRTSGPDCQLDAAAPEVRLLDADGGLVATAVPGGLGLPGPGEVPLTLSGPTSLSFFVATRRGGDCVPGAELVAVLPGTGPAELRADAPVRVCDDALAVGPVQRLEDDE